MISRRDFSAIRIGIMALSFCAAGALAQESPAPPPSGGTAAGPPLEPAQIHVPGDWADIAVLERRYKIEALRFKARDETGADWPGSDEVMVKTTDPEGWTVADKVENIDSGTVHEFDPAKSCIVAVRPGEAVLDKTSVCDDVGRPAPLNFEVELWESDETCYFPLCIFDFDFGCRFGPEGHFGSYCVPVHGDDDFIGHARLDFSAQELEAALPNVGDEFVETVVLFPCEYDVCGGDLPDYTFTYRITRMPNREIDMRGIVSATMQRSGARSEFEAIIAGLSSLQAPQKRPIEPEEARAPSAGE
jgi:hypothetical protein